MFLIIFRYLGEAILELGRQYSVEESRHIISTSAKSMGQHLRPRSGIFVILSGRVTVL